MTNRERNVIEAAKEWFESWVHEPSSGCIANVHLYEAVRALNSAPASTEAATKRPKIVCLCGSTRFYSQFQKSNYELTNQGIIVLSVGFYIHAQNEAHGEQVGCTPELKVKLDELHKRKIDLADEVFVLNVGGYIGESTRSEINYAIDHEKPVRYLETPDVAPLDADMLAKLSEGSHRCDTDCDCHCGVTYDKNWNPVISYFGRTHIECKCKPAPLDPARCEVCGGPLVPPPSEGEIVSGCQRDYCSSQPNPNTLPERAAREAKEKL